MGHLVANGPSRPGYYRMRPTLRYGEVTAIGRGGSPKKESLPPRSVAAGRMKKERTALPVPNKPPRLRGASSTTKFTRGLLACPAKNRRVFGAPHRGPLPRRGGWRTRGVGVRR